MYEIETWVTSLGMLAYNVLRLLGILGKGVIHHRHPAKRRRMKTIIQELTQIPARILRGSGQQKLDIGRDLPGTRGQLLQAQGCPHVDAGGGHPFRGGTGADRAWGAGQLFLTRRTSRGPSSPRGVGEMRFKLEQQTGDGTFHRRQADGEPTLLSGSGGDRPDARHHDAPQEDFSMRAQQIRETVGGTRRGQHHAIDGSRFEHCNKLAAPGGRGRQGRIDGDGLDDASRVPEPFGNHFPGRKSSQDEHPWPAVEKVCPDRGVVEKGLRQGFSDELARNDINVNAQGHKCFGSTPPDRGDPETIEDTSVPAQGLDFRIKTEDGILAGENDAIEGVEPADQVGHCGRIRRHSDGDDGELDRNGAAETDQTRGDAALPRWARDQDSFAGKGLSLDFGLLWIVLAMRRNLGWVVVPVSEHLNALRFLPPPVPAAGTSQNAGKADPPWDLLIGTGPLQG